jgi:hypothetical protein
VRTPVFCLAAWLLLAVALRADDGLADALQARALLGADVWSRVIRIENEGSVRRYPRTVFALVFEICGRLWFYTDLDGTQSFSLFRNRMAEEKADFGPLLRDIEPGFVRWREVPDPPATAPLSRGPLRNACFIKSIAAWRALGALAGRPQLLTYYLNTPAGLRGHTVLTYVSHDRLEVLDPDWPKSAIELSEALAGDAVALARAVVNQTVVNARLLPLPSPVPPKTVVASNDRRRIASPLPDGGAVALQ